MNDRYIKRDTIYGHLISTVRLPGFDEGERDAYETMVFKMTDSTDEAVIWHELDVERYPTQKEAEIGHRIMVGRWERILNPVEICFDCGDPADDYLIDENEYGEQQKLPICRACRFDRFGKDNEEF